MRVPIARSLLVGLGIVAAVSAARAEPFAEPDKPRQIVLAITSQLRGSVSSRIGEPDRSPGGLAHLAVLIRRVRESFPEVVLVDAGNALSGAPDALLPIGADTAPPILAAMNRLLYDAAVPAERDLDRNADAWNRAVQTSAFPWLAANLHPTGGTIPEDAETKFRAFTVVRRGDIRIAVIGLVSPGVLLGKAPAFRERLRITDPEEAAKREAAQLRAEARADLVIAIGAGSAADESEREAGLLENLALPNSAGVIADRTPGLDLVISGRGRMPRKDAVARPNRSYRVPLIEPVPSSRALTLVVMDVARNGTRWRVANLSQETQWAGEATEADVLAAMAGPLEETRTRLAQRLPLFIAGRMVKRAFLACAGALGHAAAVRVEAKLNAGDLAVDPPLPRRAAAGEPELSLLPSLWAAPRWRREEIGRQMTRGDVGRWIGQDDPLVAAELTGRQIALLLEPYVRQMHGWRIPASQVLFPGGLDIALAPGRSEAVAVRLSGALDSVQDDHRYRVWMARYHRFGGGGLAARALIEPDQPARLLPVTLREAVLEYVADPAAPLPAACGRLLSRHPPEPRNPKKRSRSALRPRASDLAQRSLRTAAAP